MRLFVLFFFGLFIPSLISAQAITQNLDNALGSVVTVAVYETEEFGNRQLGFRGGAKPSIEAYQKALNLSGSRGSGSGFVINKNGTKYVITNAHVIENAAKGEGNIAVFSVDRTKYNVRVVGGDSFYDIAVLEFLDKPGDELKEINFRQKEASVGEKVYAIGNPLGEYPYSVSDGIISAKNRVRSGNTGKFGFLQTTATVIWGNSGGPLIDEGGEVVGINSQIAFAPRPGGGSVWLSQINFALEGSLSERLVDEIINNNGRVNRAYFGVELSALQEYNPQTRLVTTGPVTLTGILEDAPSKRTLRGLEGATITKVNGEIIQSIEDILYEFENTRSGEKVSITFSLNGNEKSVNLASIELTSKELESIADFFFLSRSNISRVENVAGVQFEFSENDMQKRQGGSFQKYNSKEQKPAAKYVMLAAGISNENYERLWVIDDLYDLGAALRLTGLSGILDFYVTGQGKYNGQVGVFRNDFTNNEYTILKKLWY